MFIGTHHLEYLILSESGDKVTVGTTTFVDTVSAQPKLKLSLPRPMARVFRTPLSTYASLLVSGYFLFAD